jgi:hypothetical protein
VATGLAVGAECIQDANCFGSASHPVLTGNSGFAAELTDLAEVVIGAFVRCLQT